MNYQQAAPNNVKAANRLRITDIAKQHGNLIKWGNGVQVYLQLLERDNAMMLFIYNLNTNRVQYVAIHEKAANLHQGGVRLYFICPETGMKCLDLYLSAITGMFKSRHSPTERLYYPQQAVSKKWRETAKLEQITDRINRLTSKRATYTYNGKVTKRLMLQYVNINKAIQTDYTRNVQLLTA